MFGFADDRSHHRRGSTCALQVQKLGEPAPGRCLVVDEHEQVLGRRGGQGPVAGSGNPGLRLVDIGDESGRKGAGELLHSGPGARGRIIERRGPWPEPGLRPRRCQGIEPVLRAGGRAIFRSSARRYVKTPITIPPGPDLSLAPYSVMQSSCWFGCSRLLPAHERGGVTQVGLEHPAMKKPEGRTRRNEEHSEAS